MAEILTFSLKNGQKKSDAYFDDVAAFTDHINIAAKTALGEWLDLYQEYIRENKIEDLRGSEVYAFELISLGVLWPIYIQDALNINKFYAWGLSRLVEIRQKYTFSKKTMDALRGVFGNKLLFSKNNKVLPVMQDLTHLNSLVNWLEATGEFKEEVKRFKNWQAFIATLPETQVAKFLAAILDFGEYFNTRGHQELGDYTPNVEKFIKERSPAHSRNEDLAMVRRTPVEYHLNMLGMEILNRDVQDAFNATPKKVVFVPPCLRIKKDECEAYETPIGDHCNACEPNCRVHQITQLGKKHNFEVYFLPRRLSSLGKGRDKTKAPVFGVVGVACPLTVTTGGWQTRDMGVPALGLPLDHCGCHWHWDLDKGVVTDVNFGELLKMMGE